MGKKSANKTQKAPAAAKSPKKSKKSPVVQPEESSSGEEESCEEKMRECPDNKEATKEVVSEEEEKPKKKSKKRKSEAAKETPKKQKLDSTSSKAGEEVISLFVIGFCKDETTDSLSAFFSKHSIQTADIRKLKKKGMAFVDLATSSDLDKALAVSGSELNNKTVHIHKAEPRGEKPPGKPKKQKEATKSRGEEKAARGESSTLFVKNLSWKTDENSLVKVFKGSVDAHIPMDKKSGKSKGFAFIKFNTPEEASEAFDSMKGAVIDGRQLQIRNFAKDKCNVGGGRDGGFKLHNSGASGDSKTLFIRNLSYKTGESTLRELFEGCVKTRIPIDDSGKPKGFAFVEFDNHEKAAEALDTMKSSTIDGRQVTIDFAIEKSSGSFGGGGFGDSDFGGDSFKFAQDGGFGGQEKGGILNSAAKRKTFDDSD